MQIWTGKWYVLRPILNLSLDLQIQAETDIFQELF